MIGISNFLRGLCPTHCNLKLFHLRLWLMLMGSFGVSHLHGQDMLKALKREHGMVRYGIGLQTIENTMVNVQLFHGFFCSNSDSYATYNILEIGFGAENLLGVVGTKPYENGSWQKGGWRAELHYLVPILTFEGPMVFQLYGGGGLQTGLRNYSNSLGDQSKFATGLNGLVRAELVTHGFELGDGLWFFSVYADLKYHQDISFSNFNYFAPTLGIRARKGR